MTTTRDARPGEWIERQTDTREPRMVNHILAADGISTACGVYVDRPLGLGPSRASLDRHGARIYHDCKTCAAVAKRRAERGPEWTRSIDGVVKSKCGRFEIERVEWVLPRSVEWELTDKLNEHGGGISDTLKDAKEEAAEILRDEALASMPEEV